MAAWYVERHDPPGRAPVLHHGHPGDTDELLDAYLFVENTDALYAEFAGRGVEFTRGLANTPWHAREFVVKHCDGRLLAFGANQDQ
jgi:hypothetical protein